MHILKLTFNLLTIFGCWRPNSWSSLHKRLVYYVYTSIIFLLLNTFMISQLIDVILTLSNAEDISDNFFALIAMCITCCKVLILLINRKNITMLIDILMEKPCRPSKSTEMKILYKFDKSIQINTWRFVHLGIITVSSVILSSLLINFRNRKLTYKAWLPFDYSSAILFYITFTHQMTSLVAAMFINIGCDTLICGLLVHICCQIEILTYRLRKIMSYSNIIRDCVYQHYYIFRFAVIVNAKFRLTLTVQFVMSMMMICFSLYHLSKTTSKAKHLEIILYICCMLTELFFYCWYGNEVKLK
ncbi:odorant receptor 46a isoform X2 [Solenopsis invicta]|nr:odorant receptor 46a isoform X2 [Solenopsis invicta]